MAWQSSLPRNPCHSKFQEEEAVRSSVNKLKAMSNTRIMYENLVSTEKRCARSFKGHCMKHRDVPRRKSKHRVWTEGEGVLDASTARIYL